MQLTTSPSPFSPDMFFEKIIRNPVGANPRDINNPLSINQLTKRDYNISSNLSSPTNIQQQQSLHHTQHNITSKVSSPIVNNSTNNHQFTTPSTLQLMQQHQHQQQQQQQQQHHHHHHHHQLLHNNQNYLGIGSSTVTSASTPTTISQIHQHNLALNQHLQQFSHHFPVVSESAAQNNITTTHNVKQTVDNLVAPSTPSTTSHHLVNDNDSGAISVT